MDCTLCMPDEQKSCFACCPPIRPAGYEHLPYRNILKRMLRENTAGFQGEERGVRPITGFSCWALGYLDREYRRVGCLLHPQRNNGSDLRFRVDYEAKCRRETCPESKTFSLLAPLERRYWLRLTEGLDSFSYSSRKENPLFTLLKWGAPLLSAIAGDEEKGFLQAPSFLKRYSFFGTTLAPKANAYLLRTIVLPGHTQWLRDERFRDRFECLSMEIHDALRRPDGAPPEGIPTQKLDLEGDFLDLVRLLLRFPRIHPEQALYLKSEVDQRLESFRSAM